MTDSTDRMSSPFRRHTSLPRARRAPRTMVNRACWHRVRHHSMQETPARGPGSGLGSGFSAHRWSESLSTSPQPHGHGL